MKTVMFASVAVLSAFASQCRASETPDDFLPSGSSTTDDAALARWGDGNRLRLSGNVGILLVPEGK